MLRRWAIVGWLTIGNAGCLGSGAPGTGLVASDSSPFGGAGAMELGSTPDGSPDGTKADTASIDSVSGEADSADASAPDTAATDTPAGDAAVADGAKADAPKPDVGQPDTAQPDTFPPDTLQPDTAPPDTTQPDTTTDSATCIPKPELCNNKDDDCDGETDETVPGMCKDGDPCSFDNCVGGKCLNMVVPGVCEDGNPCTEDDVCVNGQCLPGSAKPCGGAGACQDNSCDPVKGCSSVPNTGDGCEDGNLCTIGDTCKAGVCLPGTATTCDDTNPCTSDSCQPANGCLFAPNTAPCSDGSDCTQGDKCALGVCKPGAGQVCDDKNPCTTDTCSAASGCTFAASTVACTDNNACTVGDVCAASACKPGPATICDDKNPCTTDTCVVTTGCKSTVVTNGVACPGGTCTAGTCGGKVCGNGVIESGETCDDGNVMPCDACNATCTGAGTGSALSGDYKIAATGGDFVSFTDANAAMAKCGIKGPTTFTVAAGTYKQAGFEFGPVAGTSSQNTVKFQCAPGALVKLAGSTGAGSYGGVIRINANAAYLTLHGFDIDGTLVENKIGGSYSGPVVFQSPGGQHHITLSTLNIHDFGPAAWATTSYIGGIYIQQSTTATIDALTIQGCRFVNLAPTAAFHTQGAISTRNGSLTGMRIIGNTFTGIKGMDALNLRGGAGWKDLLIANNFFVIESDGAVEFYSGGTFVNAGQFVYNTVVLTGTALRGIAGSVTGPGLDVRNNAVLSTTNALPFVSGTPVSVAGNNCLGLKVTAGYTATPTDVLAEPKLVNAVGPFDLHLQPGSPCLAKAVALPTVTTDIDGQPRGLAPDIGADELP